MCQSRARHRKGIQPAAQTRIRDLGGIQPAQIELKVAKRIFCPQKRLCGSLGFFCLLACFFCFGFGVLVYFFVDLVWVFFVIYSYDHITSVSEKFNSTSQSIFVAKLSISRL